MRVEFEYDPDDYRGETDGKKTTWTVAGTNTGAKRHKRVVRVKRYAEGYTIDVGVGPGNSSVNRAALTLTADAAEDLAIVLVQAAREARRHEV